MAGRSGSRDLYGEMLIERLRVEAKRKISQGMFLVGRFDEFYGVFVLRFGDEAEAVSYRDGLPSGQRQNQIQPYDVAAGRVVLGVGS